MTQPPPPPSRHDDLSAWLDTADDIAPPAHLQRAIAEIPLRHPRDGVRDVVAGWQWLPFGSLWRALAAAVLISALGAAAGASSITAQVPTEDAATADSDVIDLAFALSLDEDTGP